MPSAIIIGGGVGGLTAAHELVERGFTVDVYDRRPSFGGKARSQAVVGSGTSGRRDLPGEHGFRFYPRFYTHVIDTMSRIPSPAGGMVADHLQPTTESALALVDGSTWYPFPRQRAEKPYDILAALELFFQDLEFDDGDLALFTAKILQFLTSCDARRLGAYEGMTWWDFLDGNHYSPAFQKQLRAVPRTMVAMDPQHGSARTIGTISMQLILDYARSGAKTDRTMGGPTTEMWLDPWTTYLTGRGVTLHADATIASIEVTGGAISGVTLVGGATVTADYYVLAVPIDTVIGLITPAMGALDPALEKLRTQNPDDLVSWMNGIQYFLYEDVPLVKGHTFYPDSPWALTSISQPQFWTALGLFRRRYGNGEVGGVLSVDVSDWNTPGTFIPKTAKDCTPDEIATEIWAQLKSALNGAAPDQETLRDELKHSWNLDGELEFPVGGATINHARLLVHPPGSWAVRPEAASAIPNLVLAADYVRTGTDLASMEGACEAARRAVNAILAHSGSTAAPTTIWPLEEPAELASWKALDARLYAGGHRHLFELMDLRDAAKLFALLRDFDTFTGITHVGHLLDEIKGTAIIHAILARLGVPLATP